MLSPADNSPGPATRLVAEVIAKFSGPLKQMQKNLRELRRGKGVQEFFPRCG